MAKYALVTLGCKVNQCESAWVEKTLEACGFFPAGPHEKADICIVNTCTVTVRAAMQSRQAVRRMVKSHPGARVVVTGCHAEAASEELLRIQGVAAVISNTQKPDIVNLALAALKGKNASSPFRELEGKSPFFPSQAHPAGGRARPFLKIQDGCNAFCTYCIVPYTRGRSRSLPVETVMENLRAFRSLGYREVVLTGIHLGCYGKDFATPVPLCDLLDRVVSEEVMDRVRLSSMEPMEITGRLVRKAAATDRICPHFHIPLQSGDNTILERMHRPYTREAFARRVMEIRQAIPHAAIGMDVLVGFPGETAKAYQNTFDLIEALPATYLHVFPFSPRKGTPAAGYPEQVPSRTVKDRCRRLRELGISKKRRFLNSQVGRSLRVLVEEAAENGGSKGVSDNYVTVQLNGEGFAPHRFINARILQVAPDLTVFGEFSEGG